MAAPRIREMKIDDADEAADVWLRTILVAYRAIFPLDAPAPTHAELVGEWLGKMDTGATCLVAVASGEMVGVVSAGERDDEPGVGSLARLYVVPEYWDHGVGRMLYDAAIAEFLRRRLHTASLWVLRPNLRARSWYERLGWSLTGATKPTYEPAGLDDVEYRKRLL